MRPSDFFVMVHTLVTTVEVSDLADFISLLASSGILSVFSGQFRIFGQNSGLWTRKGGPFHQSSLLSKSEHFAPLDPMSLGFNLIHMGSTSVALCSQDCKSF